jgi:inorganic pyrophosphatase
MIEMEDEEGIDHKLIAVPLPKVDLTCGQWNSLEDIPEIRRRRMKHFLEHYKDLEEGKWVKLNDFLDYDAAAKLLEEGQE